MEASPSNVIGRRKKNAILQLEEKGFFLGRWMDKLCNTPKQSTIDYDKIGESRDFSLRSYPCGSSLK